MQSGSCSFSRLEMGNKRTKIFIFKNAEKIKHEKVNSLMTVFNEDIVACRKARHFCKKGKLNSIKTSLR